MNINLEYSTGLIKRGLIITMSLCVISIARATPQSPITDFTAMPGPNPGEVILTWTNPPEPFNNYEIKYRPSSGVGDEITTLTDFNVSNAVGMSPTNSPEPPPGPASGTSSMTVSNLSPGAIYAFVMRTRSGPDLSVLSNSEVVTAAQNCSATTSDGTGSATISPLSINAGSITPVLSTFTVAASSITTGGIVALRVPDGWYPPSEFSPVGSPGYISVTSTSTASLTVGTSGQMIVASVNSGVLNGGEKLFFHYEAETCDSAPGVFRMFSQAGQCGSLVDITNSNFPGSTMAVNPGGPDHLAFEEYQYNVPLNTIVSLGLEIRDFCGNPTNSTSTINVTLKSTHYSVAGGSYPVDNTAEFDDTMAFGSASNIRGITLPVGISSTSIYYRINSSVYSPDNFIEMIYDDFYPPNFPIHTYTNVIPLSGGITGVSIDTGVLDTTQTSATFTPNGDGTDDQVFINFTVPDPNIGWRVAILTQGTTNVVHDFFGIGQTSPRVSWDGYEMFSPNIASPGNYDIEIEMDGGVIRDTSLRATLSAVGVTGIIQLSGSPLENAFVDIFGPNGFGHDNTESDGSFAIYGLAPGDYTLVTGGHNAVNYEIPLTIGNTTQVLSTIDLTAGAALRVLVSRPSAPFLPEIFGHVVAHTSDWSRQGHGSIHFGEGKTQSDAGDFWEVVQTTYTELFLEPGLTYTVHLEIPGYTVADQNIAMVAGQTQHLNYALTRSGGIKGVITLPSVTNQGVWVSVEAGPDSNTDGIFDNNDPNQRYWGGGFINTSESSTTYNIFGVPNGDYLVESRVPGFIPAQGYVTVSGNADATLDFNSFSTGGSLDVTLNVTGDSSGLGQDHGSTNQQSNSSCGDGEVPIGMSVFSRTTFYGNFVEVCLSTQTTGTAIASTTVTGLQDGTYEVFAHLRGFEGVPPGPKFGTVSGGTGNLTLTFNQYQGVLQGSITLPGSNSDYSNVLIKLDSFNFDQGDIPAISPSVNSYSFSSLGTGFYTVRAIYETTGFSIERNVQIINDSSNPSVLDLDFSGTTYSISGTVTSGASSPWNTVSSIISSSTALALKDDVDDSVFTIPGYTIFAERFNGREFDDGPDGGPGDTSNVENSTPTLDTLNVFFASYSTTGEYTIRNLAPGSYRVYNNGEFDGDRSNGNEVAEVNKIVHILSSNITGVNFTLTDGANVSGSMRIASGQSEQGRNMKLELKNSQQATIAEKEVFLSGVSVNFTLEKVPAGDYQLVVQDRDYPKKYSAKSQRIEVGGTNISNIDVELLSAARITGQLRIKTSGILLTSNNYSQFLPDSFMINGEANPWVPGGYAQSEFPIIGSDNKFTINVIPGVHDVRLRSEGFVGESAIAQGQKQFVSVLISGIEVEAGQTVDLGVVDLSEGIQVQGTVTDKNGNSLANIPVDAFPTDDPHESSAQAFTDHAGNYVLYGIDPDGIRYYNFEAAPRPDQEDFRFRGLTGQRYGEVRRTNVDTQKIVAGTITSIDFELEPANGSVSGTVTTADSGQLLVPFSDDGLDRPGVEVIMNKQGNIPIDNPLGDIAEVSNADGSFTVPGLVAGVYDLWILAKGYASGFVSGITVTDSNVVIPNIELQKGNTLSGTLTKQDGSFLNSGEVNAIIATRNRFQEVLIGNVTVDAGQSITGYSISGFQTGLSYSVLLIGEDDELILLKSSITVNADTEQNFIIRPQLPEIFMQVTKSGSDFVLRFELTKALRNSNIDLDANGTADDNEPSKIITTSGSGTLSFGSSWISADRKRIEATYTPVSGETSAVVTASVTFVSVDPATNLNHQRTKSFTVLFGIARNKSKRVTNASGGTLTLPDDTTELGIRKGMFGDDADLTVEVRLSAAAQADDFSSSSGQGTGVGVMSVFESLGPSAYPVDMAKAMNKIRTSEAPSPLSSFYEIFLPATVSHTFPEGREAQLCLKYDDTAVTDPGALNVYYYNPQSNEYTIESRNKLVDVDNTRVCVDLTHASVFTTFASSDAVIQGGGYAGHLTVKNFPNPFDLKTKTVTLANEGTSSPNQTITGTMIKYSVPQGMTGNVKIEIYDVTGEKVRTLNTSAPTAGTHYYTEWNGRNQSGKEVASGTYIARFTINGSAELFFKMVVLK